MGMRHYSGSIISRGKGQSAVCLTSYHSAENILDEHNAVTHHFTKNKPELIHQKNLLSNQVPAWLMYRTELWNIVKRAENRNNAQLEREFVFALPLSLTHGQNITLATKFIQDPFASHYFRRNQ